MKKTQITSNRNSLPMSDLKSSKLCFLLRAKILSN
jgi:hypothetical protein